MQVNDETTRFDVIVNSHHGILAKVMTAQADMWWDRAAKSLEVRKEASLAAGICERAAELLNTSNGGVALTRWVATDEMVRALLYSGACVVLNITEAQREKIMANERRVFERATKWAEALKDVIG